MLFLHTADWQLGKPYARVTDPDKRSQRPTQPLTAIRASYVYSMNRACKLHPVFKPPYPSAFPMPYATIRWIDLKNLLHAWSE